MNMSSSRPSWDEIWMNLAIDLSNRSQCKVPNRHVGCVVVSHDNTQPLATGYNGGASGDDRSCQYVGPSPQIGTSRCVCIHAEMNAVVKLDTTNPCRKKMYLTLSPCGLCYQLIVNAGITDLIVLEMYDEDIIMELKKLGVTVRLYEKNN